MARAVWSGMISFGLVSVPVGLYTATQEHEPSFHQFAKGVTDRIRYKRVNERTGREVDFTNIVRGAEVGDGEYVMVSDEELEQIAPGRSRALEISGFVDLDEIDPIYFNKAYYLAPAGEESKKTYALLRDAMAKTNRAGIGNFVMHGKEHLAAVRAAGNTLILETPFFADEVREAKAMLDHLPGKTSFSKGELNMATQLVESMGEDWNPKQCRDTYTDRVKQPDRGQTQGQRHPGGRRGAGGHQRRRPARGVAALGRLRPRRRQGGEGARQEGAGQQGCSERIVEGRPTRHPESVVTPAKTRARGAAERLAPYRAKRDFSKTGEPDGAQADDTSNSKGSSRRGTAAPRFVVQRHRARRLHYDFRLEIGGVLASWAVPKGPTLDPNVRRAAFHVEDHPLEYFDFEGVIPAGEYGGGDVIVWDAGTWEPKETADPGGAVAAGELHLDLQGEKLQGRFVLVRTRTDSSGKEQWLMLHKHPEYAATGWNAEDHPRSVLSGRTNDEVKADPDRLWRSDLPAARASVLLRADRTAAVSDDELAALDALPAAGRWSVFGRELRVTNLDKVLFPGRSGEAPVTKRELLRYSAQIAPTVLPYLRGRALNLHRFPSGAGAKGFWHKALPGHAPQWLPRWDTPAADTGETVTYLVVDEPAALVWAANFGALEWHAWTTPFAR